MRVTQLLTLVKMKDKAGHKINDWNPSKLFIKMYVIANVISTDLDKIASVGGRTGLTNYTLCKEKLIHVK